MHPNLLRVLLGATLLLSSACGAASEDATAEAGADEAGLQVVATTTILGDLAAQVVGDHGEVAVLMAPGQDPHGFSPSAQQAQQVREADLVLANGLQLEEGLLDLIEAAEQDGVPVLRLAEHLDPLAVGETAEEHAEHADDEHEGDEHEDGHDHGPEDPHVWFDPVRMAEGARVLADHVAEVAGDDADWAARGEQVAGELEALDAEVREVLSAVPEECRRLVTNHDNLRYLANRYDLEVVGTVVPGSTTGVEPSARDFAQLAATVREEGVPAIFAETIQSTELADSLAAEVGRDVAVVELYTDSLGAPGSGAETYPGMMRTVAQRVADALSSC